MRVETMNKNQTIVINNNEIVYFSYNTKIATIQLNNIKHIKKLKLTHAWDYSQTTLKYLYQFLKMYMHDIYIYIEKASNKKAVMQKLIDNNTIETE